MEEKLNYIGDKAITAKEAARMIFEAKTPFIIKLQEEIMEAVKEQVKEGQYDISCTYVNDDPSIDQLIEDWLIDLGYEDIDREDMKDENNCYTESVLTFGVPYFIEEDEEESKEQEEEAAKEEEEEKSTSKLDPDLQAICDSPEKEEKAEVTKKFYTSFAKVKEIEEKQA